MTLDVVRTMADAAGLPLAAGREAALLPILRVWLADSAALNLLMQNKAYQEVLPISSFQHGVPPAGGTP